MAALEIITNSVSNRSSRLPVQRTMTSTSTTASLSSQIQNHQIWSMLKSCPASRLQTLTLKVKTRSIHRAWCCRRIAASFTPSCRKTLITPPTTTYSMLILS